MNKINTSPVLSMLYERERKGIPSNLESPFLDRLSFHAAWNRRRLRDMALVVGPNSPAATESSTATELLRSSSAGRHHGSDDDESSSARSDESSGNYSKGQISNKGLRPKLRSSMKHKGCINTASWLSTGWKLSFAKQSMNSQHEDIFKSVGAHLTEECPTQLMTAGDDRTVHLWDVSGAMGSTSLPISPHPTTRPAFLHPKEDLEQDILWDKSTTSNKDLSGSVVPLGFLPTSHRGNIFHVEPVPYQPGLISTCSADGSLQLADVERILGPTSSTSSSGSHAYTTLVVSSPEFSGSPDDRQQANLFGRIPLSSSSMAFSHRFIDSNTGLLCTERGLLLFDLRLSAREQPRQNLYTDTVCKACALWNHPRYSNQTFNDNSSCYVFAGGTSGTVGLLDLRMGGDGSENRSSTVLQTYLPSTLSANTQKQNNISTTVSGINVSKDGNELLVSYDCDQIYAFDIVSQDQSYKEKAMYGGHLNRRTFLKEAKYAGPRDQYICTGSDSGHAWFYDRDSGSVAALLKADRVTCNGVIPHPSLPLFITYGIDNTAKLWRATSSFASAPRSDTYNKDALAYHWKSAQRKLSQLPELKESGLPIGCLPDSIHCGLTDADEADEAAKNFLLSLFTRRSISWTSLISNSFEYLPELLQLNYNTCLHEVSSNAGELSVRSGLHAMARNISVARLRHQADRLGLRWSMKKLPLMEFNELQQAYMRDDKMSSCFSADLLLHPADLVPDFPMDWMPYDLEMTPDPKTFWCRSNIVPSKENLRDDGYIDDTSCEKDESMSIYSKPWLNGGHLSTASNFSTKETIEDAKTEKDALRNDTSSVRPSSNAADSKHIAAYSEDRALDILLETILVLKDGGSKALAAGSPLLAARRYEKALLYCSLLFLKFHVGNLYFLKAQHCNLQRKKVAIQWTSFLKALITIRLNLSMTLQKKDIAEWKAAIEQARLALEELKPFTSRPGQSISSKDQNLDEEKVVPNSVFQEARELQVKAYFRLGTAQYGSKNFNAAVTSFQRSIQLKKESGGEPDAIMLRRLAEATRDKAKKQERMQKRYKTSMQDGDS